MVVCTRSLYHRSLEKEKSQKKLTKATNRKRKADAKETPQQDWSLDQSVEEETAPKKIRKSKPRKGKSPIKKITQQGSTSEQSLEKQNCKTPIKKGSKGKLSSKKDNRKPDNSVKPSLKVIPRKYVTKAKINKNKPANKAALKPKLVPILQKHRVTILTAPPNKRIKIWHHAPQVVVTKYTQINKDNVVVYYEVNTKFRSYEPSHGRAFKRINTARPTRLSTAQTLWSKVRTKALSRTPLYVRSGNQLKEYTRKMAVKKHELVHENTNLDVLALVHYIQVLTDQRSYLPPLSELVKYCRDIVKCLALSKIEEPKFWETVNSVEVFLMRLLPKLRPEKRHELIAMILNKFYSYTSDPQSDAGPATSSVLIILDSSDTEAMPCATRWLVQQADNGPGGAGLRASLSCFYRWLYQGKATRNLGDWVLAYVKALEENDRFNILLEVSVDNMGELFLTLDDPLSLRESVANCIIYIMSSLRESVEALDKITPNLDRVLGNLATDSGQWSRHLLQSVVDILTSMVNRQMKSDKKEIKEKYGDIATLLEKYMASSRGGGKIKTAPWRLHRGSGKKNSLAMRRRVGLLNLGNTCYMNSVVQVLLITRHFSTHVVLKMNALAYWAKMADLFAKMTHTIYNRVSPEEFFNVMKPSFFNRNQQQDSSEFLGYMFELLQSYENVADYNFDYSNSVVIRYNVASRARAITHTGNSSSESDGDAGPRRSASPRPGSSAAGSSSGCKRSYSEIDNQGPYRKRLRRCEPTVLANMRRESFIDSIFGGVLLTRVKCNECQSSSLSRDVFRDLQLSFPPDKNSDQRHSVQGLLEYYCSKETLTGVNSYACRDCGVLRDAERSVLVETPPKYLILVLKNFQYDSKLKVQAKLIQSGMIHNPTLVLPTVRSQAEHATYTIYAAIIHTGTTLHSGHYHTLAKENGKWYCYNDELVTEDPENGQLHRLTNSSTPYILFYRRTDIDEGTIPAMNEMPVRLQQKVMAHNKVGDDTLHMVLRNRL